MVLSGDLGMQKEEEEPLLLHHTAGICTHHLCLACIHGEGGQHPSALVAITYSAASFRNNSLDMQDFSSNRIPHKKLEIKITMSFVFVPSIDRV